MRPRHSIQQRLEQRRALFGILQTHPNPALTEMAGMCGYDFIILDDEHGLFEQQDHVRALQALGSVDSLAFMRIRGHDPTVVGRYLDMGADGIVAPHVESAEWARELVRAMEYPPAGTRGFGASAHRTSRYGLNLATHLKAPRGDAQLIVMIESALGVANVDEILSVDGVNGVFIGPLDLSADLGAAGDFTQPSYIEALSRVEKAAASHGKLLGTGAHGTNTLETLLARGHNLVMLDADMPLIQGAMTARVAKARGCL